MVFQSTPSQRGRLRRYASVGFARGISIHALAKRATGYRSDGGTKFVISIHALAKRATVIL